MKKDIASQRPLTVTIENQRRESHTFLPFRLLRPWNLPYGVERTEQRPHAYHSPDLYRENRYVHIHICYLLPSHS